MAVVDKIMGLEQQLVDIRLEYEAEIAEYVNEVAYLQGVCNEQTMELQRLNGLLDDREEEIMRLREHIYSPGEFDKERIRRL